MSSMERSTAFGIWGMRAWLVSACALSAGALVCGCADSVTDAADPTVECIVGSLALPGIGAYAGGMALLDDHAYLADWRFGLRIVDTSEPTSPVIVGNVDLPGSPEYIAVSNNQAYVSVGRYQGVQIVDVGDPTDPKIIGIIDTPNAKDIEVVGNVVYVTDGSSGLLVVDASDPASPEVIGSVDTPDFAFRVVVVGNYAYVTTGIARGGNVRDGGPGSLQVIDISEPNQPKITGSVSTPGNGWGIAVAGGYAYVADASWGVIVVDVADPVSPVIVGGVRTPGAALDIAIVGNEAYIADLSLGLFVVDVGNAVSPTVVGSVQTSGGVGVALDDQYVYLSDGHRIEVISQRCGSAPMSHVPVDKVRVRRDVSIEAGLATQPHR